ncbi:oligosaccharide repeat unit polymerase family protein [uncultured Methanobrevibacter sp.]|uniref:oligosaccharide repeat unit polymerase family protein n=1 Tax=uncultured Methanobrevibacter sp. TaxID=253161 RepID=UPI0025F05682|nr:oligosaccharide repeat unit polymerase family protein [uncultured Methanobrevibacter sp.]
MRYIYSIITTICRKIELEIKKSFLFNIIHTIFIYIENLLLNSHILKLYPQKDKIKIKSKILNEDLLSPPVVILVFSLFLICGLSAVSSSLVITIIIGFISFLLGALILPKFFLNNRLCENQNGKNKFISFKVEDIYAIGFVLFIVALIFFCINIGYVKGIPLLKPSLRYQLKAALTMPVFLIIPAIAIIESVYIKYYQENKLTRRAVRFRFLILTGVGIIILLFLAYRTPILALILLMIIIGYYGKVISLSEIIALGLIGIVGIISIGYIRSLNEMMISKSTNPFYTLQDRAEFTLHVLDQINFLSGYFGIMHGGFLLKALPGSDYGPRTIVGQLISWRSGVTITPTLIGGMLIDFGKVGVAVGMCLLGFILGIGYKLVKISQDYVYIGIYALILTYTILGVETGILDLQVILYFAVGALVYIANIVYSNNAKK